MSVTAVPLLRDLQGQWGTLAIRLTGGETITLPDLYPFMSVTDLKRMIWIRQGGDPRWAPENVFLGVRSSKGIRPVEFHWPTSVMGGSVDLPDPLDPANRRPSPALVDEAGNRRPVGPTMIGGLILETALSPEILQTGTLPIIDAIPLVALQVNEELTTPLFAGFYQLYFPWLKAPAEVLDAGNPTSQQRDAYAAAVPYLEDRGGRIAVVQDALKRGVGGAGVTMTKMVRLRWILPPPASKPETLEKTFYALKADKTIPFLRFFPAGGKSAPILKLALKADGSPLIDDPKIYAQYLSQTAPAEKSAVIMARIPLQSPHVERGTAFSLLMFEDGNSDITLEVPQRGATYVSAVAADAQRILADVIQAIGFEASATPILRDLHATYRWTHPDPRKASPVSTATLLQRVAALTPFLDRVPPLPEDKALAIFQWRAVSNYESEPVQFAYITQLVLRGEETGATGMAAHQQYVADVAQKFGLSKETASVLLERWMDRRGEAVAPTAGAGSLAVPKHSTGALVAISGAHPEYFMEIQGVDSLTELQRIISVSAVLLGADRKDLLLTPPVQQIEAVAAAVAIIDEGVKADAEAEGLPEDEIDFGEMDPAMAALMADLGLGGGEEEEEEVPPPLAVPEEVVSAVALPETAAPNVDAVVAAVEEECRGIPWDKSDQPIKIAADWWMAKLKKEDEVMFGYSAGETGRVKGYSKSCQRSDGRQPNIMTLSEYARIRRCYEGRVRFVDLPPRKPTDLPDIPKYNPKTSYPDEYFTLDPVTKKPMWTVYGYENKTTPGQYMYLMCADLWCVRDNLPLIREEYVKNQESCPFCSGKAIRVFEQPAWGESVIVRIPKKATGKLHQFIGTMTRTQHPKGWDLPCCDSSSRLLTKYLEAAYTGKITWGRDIETGEAAPVVPAEVGDEVQPPQPMQVREEGVADLGMGKGVDYQSKFTSMQAQYILGNDKALDAGKIALLPPLLDNFFGQNGPRALETRGIRPTFREGATIFVRVGVDNSIRHKGLNFFAGLTPLMNYQTAEQTQRFIITRRMVRAFESANYGTLLLEFAARSTLSDADLAKSLPAFAAKFGYTLGPARPHVLRLYRAWTSFLKYLKDPREPKKLRHLEHLMAQPGIILPRGLLLVVLEQTGDRIDVVCPSFGIPTASVFGDVPVAFMWHDKRDESWEPIVLYNNTKDAVLFFTDRQPELESIPKTLRVSLQRWLRDWRSSSAGCGRPAPPPHVWTPDKDTSSLPRLTQLRIKYVPSHLVRDRSNRLAGVIITPKTTGGDGAMFVPCLDDGALADATPRIYEAEMLPPTPLTSYLRFYKELATQYPSLVPTAVLARMDATAQLVGFVTAAGTMIPTAPAPVDTQTGGLPVQQLDAFPWERDAQILRAPNAPSLGQVSGMEESTASVEEQAAEAYQHIRLSMARWLQRDARAPALRQQLATLLKANLPLYEKRKRLDIVLEPLLREWIAVEETAERKSLPLLREDCLAIPAQEPCDQTAGCRWSGGRCLIHVPVASVATNPIRVFTARLSDEILRYAGQRREILDNRVPTIRTPRGVVRVGDELYMATKQKESPSAILERLGFTGEHAPYLYPEEVIRFEDLAEKEEETAVDEKRLPLDWQEKGMEIASPPENVEDAARLVFASVTGRSIPEWESIIQEQRKAMGLPGNPGRPFQWSIQDFYVLGTKLSTNVLFIRLRENGGIRIDRWIAPAKKTAQELFMIFWGERELLVYIGKNYRFQLRDLPNSVKMALDVASPIPDEEAQGVVEEKNEEVGQKEVIPAPAPTMENLLPSNPPTPAPTS